MSPWEAGRDLRDTPSLGRRHAGAPGAHRARRAARDRLGARAARRPGRAGAVAASGLAARCPARRPGGGRAGTWTDGRRSRGPGRRDGPGRTRRRTLPLARLRALGGRRRDAVPRRLPGARPGVRSRRAGRARRAGPGRAACGVGRGGEAADHAGPERRVAAATGNGGVLELARLALSALVVGLAGCGGGGGGGAGTLRVPGEGGRRVTVEVLNASGRSGLARSGVRVLRQAGIDVVSFGNAPAAVGTLDSTRIVVRRPAAGVGVGDQVRRALGVGRVMVQPDTTKLLDASVFLGADFAPRLEVHP